MTDTRLIETPSISLLAPNHPNAAPSLSQQKSLRNNTKNNTKAKTTTFPSKVATAGYGSQMAFAEKTIGGIGVGIGERKSNQSGRKTTQGITQQMQ